MANLAIILKKMGKKVTGTDVDEEFITDRLLKSNKISYLIGFNTKILPKKSDLVIYSAAHQGDDNPLIIRAKKLKMRTAHQIEVIAEVISRFNKKIAVCGSHGKTTTSALLAYTLINLKIEPSYLVGAPGFNNLPGGDLKKDGYFVVEADEYGLNPPKNTTPKFSYLDPDYIICNNIDFDHPDIYQNIDQTKKAFLNFFNEKKLFICADDNNLMSVAKQLTRKQYRTFGFSALSDLRVISIFSSQTMTRFTVRLPNHKQTTFTVNLFGKKNISNAAGVILFLLDLGFSPERIKTAMTGFSGAQRRFQLLYQNKDYLLLDDYGHHPAEIEATIEAARARFDNRRIIIIFQPHTYSRTAVLRQEFVRALTTADKCLLLPIFSSAREKKEEFKISSIDLERLAKKAGKKNLQSFENRDLLLSKLEKIIKPQDIIFTMGAGDVYKMKDKIIKILDQKLKIKNPSFVPLSGTSKGKKNDILKFKSLKVEENKELFPYLSLRTRPRAKFFLEARTKEELIKAIKISNKYKIPFFILGGGTNLAVINDNLDGLVVKNSYYKKGIISETKKQVDLLVSSGYPVSQLISETVEAGYEGFEYHKGLPGTVGGAIYMNSKWTRPESYFCDNLISAELIDKEGRVKKVDKKYFKFGYDFSILQQTKEIILEAVFRLNKIEPAILEKRAEESLNYRKKTQPIGQATSGCFFKNPGKQSAGLLIDRSGLKGFRVGDFIVSEKHANFIINLGDGNAEDLLELIEIIKSRVRERFKVELEEEVIII